MVTQEKFRKAIEALNQSGLLKRKLEIKGNLADEEEREEFLIAVEEIPEEREEEIPDIVVEVYNDIVDGNIQIGEEELEAEAEAGAGTEPDTQTEGKDEAGKGSKKNGKKDSKKNGKESNKQKITRLEAAVDVLKRHKRFKLDGKTFQKLVEEVNRLYGTANDSESKTQLKKALMVLERAGVLRRNGDEVEWV